MKKIVALVLSLVMVLGLATTAFGAAAYDLYDANGDAVEESITVTAVEAFDEDGTGNIAYYTLQGASVYYGKFVECKRAEATNYVTLAGNEGVYKYLKAATVVEYDYTAVPFTAIGKDCGELNLTAKDKAYVVTDEDGNKTFYKKVEGGQTVLMVDGDLVTVSSAGTPKNHTWVVTAYNEDEEPTTVKCKDCDVVGTCYATKLAAPAGSTFDAVQVGTYWVVVGAAPAADSDKVESAETFDAGIAMYVGMSVMAAAGSAVVLKKKD